MGVEVKVILYGGWRWYCMGVEVEVIFTNEKVSTGVSRRK